MTRAEVADVRPFVNRRQDLGLFALHPAASAHPWLAAAKATTEPVVFEG